MLHHFVQEFWVPKLFDSRPRGVDKQHETQEKHSSTQRLSIDVCNACVISAHMDSMVCKEEPVVHMDFLRKAGAGRSPLCQVCRSERKDARLEALGLVDLDIVAFRQLCRLRHGPAAAPTEGDTICTALM